MRSSERDCVLRNPLHIQRPTPRQGFSSNLCSSPSERRGGAEACRKPSSSACTEMPPKRGGRGGGGRNLKVRSQAVEWRTNWPPLDLMAAGLCLYANASVTQGMGGGGLTLDARFSQMQQMSAGNRNMAVAQRCVCLLPRPVADPALPRQRVPHHNASRARLGAAASARPVRASAACA